MRSAGTAALNGLHAMLWADDHSPLNERLAYLAKQREIGFEPMKGAQVVRGNIGPELLDRTGAGAYPAVHLYCEKVSNTLREKFRTFSGTVTLAAEIRVTHDRSERLEELLSLHVDAVTQVLEMSRGEWAPGVQYAGGYEITMGPVKRGGRNYMQAAKIRLDIDVSA